MKMATAKSRFLAESPLISVVEFSLCIVALTQILLTKIKGWIKYNLCEIS